MTVRNESFTRTKRKIMGVFDTVWIINKKGEDVDIQIKCNESAMLEFIVGSEIELSDGIYFGWEGAFVVKDKVIIAGFDSREPFLFDKWGNNVDYPMQ